jgi:mannose-6-phosphate isomerase-like protein (cupin superfamily)
VEIVNLNKAVPFVTLDSASIREILAPRNSSLKNQSLAEARLKPGISTKMHYHKAAEEIYYVLEGIARMEIEAESSIVGAQDAIVILPGKEHRITNIGNTDLVFLCCCAPAYTHEDTQITEVA